MRRRSSLLAAVIQVSCIAGGIEAQSAASIVPTRAVREARLAGTPSRVGDRVTIAGRVSMGSGIVDVTELNIHVQDSTGGVFVDTDTPITQDVDVGDSVIVTGTIATNASGTYLDSADVKVLPFAKRAPIPELVPALRPDHLSAVVSRLVTIDGFVANASLGGPEQTLVLADTTSDGNYVTVVGAPARNAVLDLNRFSRGDHVRVTGILERRTSTRTGITRFTLSPRARDDVTARRFTAKARQRLISYVLGSVALLSVAALAWRSRRLAVAERRLAEGALRESAAGYRRLIEQAPIGIGVLDEGRVVFANSALAEFLAAPDADALRDRPFIDVVHPDERAQAAENLARTHEHPTASERTLRRFVRLDGEIVEAEITKSAIVYEGRPCVQAVVYDVTERSRAARTLAQSEEHLRQAQKLEAIGHLAGGIAHDFNNILTAIRGNADFLLEGCVKCGTVAAEALDIDQAADRAAGLTSQLLAFSRQQPIKPRVIALDELVRNMERMLRRLVPESIDQTFELRAPEGLVYADPGQVEQILMNLCVNARDAMPKGGVLTIRTALVTIREEDGRREGPAGAPLAPGQYVSLVVNDSGHGMDEETQRRIFEPFFTTKQLGKGTGLGLSTVYGIVKQSEGQITLKSRPDEGTSFTIYLPRTSAEPQETVAETPKPTRRGDSATVLIVEDEPAIRAITVRTLQKAGYHVIVASDGLEALKAVRAYGGPIHLLLTDVILPALNGSEVASYLRKVRPDMRVLFISGYTDDHIAHHGVLEAGIDLMEKPFTPAQLLERVAQALDSTSSIAKAGAT